MMNILLLGNADSRWTKEFAERILIPLKHKVTVVADLQKCKYLDFYHDNNISIKKQKPCGRIQSFIPFIRVTNSAKRTYRDNVWDHYDLIINLFVNHKDLKLASLISTDNTKVVLYFIGSDLYRKTKVDLLLNKMLLKKVDRYVVGSQGLLTEFKRKFNNKKEASVIRFGVTTFDCIRNKLRTKQADDTEQHKKLVFCVGYNARFEQQHIKVLSVFDSLSSEEKSRIKLIIPMTYKYNDDYYHSVAAIAEKTGIEFFIPTKFMNNDEMAEMWLNVDFFINAQTTDSLSASVLEALYAGAILINGSWLNYPEYKEFDIEFFSFNDFNELKEIVKKGINNELRSESSHNRAVLENKLTWTVSMEQWEKVLNGLK